MMARADNVCVAFTSKERYDLHSVGSSNVHAED